MVNYYLNKLEKEDLVERDYKVSRGTFLTEEGRSKAMELLNIAPPTCPHCGEFLTTVPSYPSVQSNPVRRT